MGDTAFERWGNKLPLGFYIKEYHVNDFELGPVRGSLRRELTNLLGRSLPRSQLAVLKHCVTILGNKLGPPTEDTLRLLPMPDVEYLLYVLQLRELPEFVIDDIECQNVVGNRVCGAKTSVRVPMRNVGTVDATTEIEYVGGAPTVLRSFFDPVEQREIAVRYRIPNLGDHIGIVDQIFDDETGERTGDTMFDQHAATMVDYDGRGRGLTKREFEDMNFHTINALINNLSDVHPASVDTDLEVTCPSCRQAIALDLPLMRWTRPLGPAKTEVASGSS